jgi:AcrR family transcriptional regulator
VARAAAAKVERPRLDRATVVATAADLLDEGGVESFSMTRLGQRLGVTAMALYRHVADRDDLEQALVEHVLQEFGAVAHPAAEWDAALTNWMNALRRCWLAHPWVGSLLGSRTKMSPTWLSVLDELAQILLDAGLPTPLVAREVERISRTTIGILLQEVQAPLPFAGLTDAAIAQLPTTAQPRWRDIEKALQRYSNDDLFDDIISTTMLRLRGGRFAHIG